jgi:hypothetical protein
MDVKALINSIIEDLTSNEPISKIMLKAQAISFSLGLDEFSKWVRLEQNGYQKGDEIPEYRRTRCSAKVNLTQGFKRVTNLDVPIDAIPDKTAREMLSYIYFSEPITELEKLANDATSDGLLQVIAPAYAYRKAQAIFPMADIDMLWKIVNVTAASGVVEKVKSKMLDFFLQLDQKTQMGVDFDKLEGKQEAKQVLNQTINAGIYHSGSGDVNVVDSVVGNTASVTMTATDIETVKKCISDILSSKELEDDIDVQEEIAIIQNEVKKENPSRKIIKKSLLFLKEVAVQTSASVCAQAIATTLGIV